MTGKQLKACFLALICCTVSACSENEREKKEGVLRPVVITEKVSHDSDDPAIWIDFSDHSRSLILGTDKDEDGAICVFDLQGRILKHKCIHGIKRPNNIDVEYGLLLDGKSVDIAVFTERLAGKLRVFTLPDMKAVDSGGIPVFAGEKDDAPMGVALYKRQQDGAIYAVVSRKNGPVNGGYLWQYRLEDNGRGGVRATLVRKFGNWSGKKEIEAVAVDDSTGYVYYSDEGYGVRVYHADPRSNDAERELDLFAETGFAADHEGIAVFSGNDGKRIVAVSDQGAGKLQFFSGAGSDGDTRVLHRFVHNVTISARNTDGIDASSVIRTADFPDGLFVAMSDDSTFHYYSIRDLGL
ncbi:phytase [Chlorobium sp.]|uniref:phytase n=1 Tax=Chlorobium sp. TaxID=1095 RepID=UPI002F401D6A